MTPDSAALAKIAEEALVLAGAATKGPWTARPFSDSEETGWDVVLPPGRGDWMETGVIRCVNIHDNEENDAAFIVASREMLPTLARAVLDLLADRCPPEEEQQFREACVTMLEGYRNLQAQVQRVRDLHASDSGEGDPVAFCVACAHTWPCPTIAALSEPEETL